MKYISCKISVDPFSHIHRDSIAFKIFFLKCKLSLDRPLRKMDNLNLKSENKLQYNFQLIVCAY